MNSGSVLASKFKSAREAVEPLLRSMRGGAGSLPGTGSSIGGQLIETFVIVVVLSITMNLLERNFAQLKKYQTMAVEVYPLTYTTEQRFIQDPTSCFPLLMPSKDERNGAEYSYSCYINVSSDNFTGQPNALRHIFHKGSKTIYPLMAPGVFFKADTNTLRVYQNSTLNWDRHVDVANIPLNKWFHLVVMLKGNALDVYINGNLANRHKFIDVPKLNYSDFWLLNGSTVNSSSTDSNQCAVMYQDAAGNLSPTASSTFNTKVLSTDSKMETKNSYSSADNQSSSSEIKVVGAMIGHVSRVKYYAFALSYVQIDKLLREGPNQKIYKTKKNVLSDNPFAVTNTTSIIPNAFQFSQNLPYYQTDDWWTSSAAHQGLGPQ